MTGNYRWLVALRGNPHAHVVHAPSGCSRRRGFHETALCGVIAALFLCTLILSGAGAPAHADSSTWVFAPLVLGRPVEPPLVHVSGRVTLQGRSSHQGASIKLDENTVTQTDPQGNFSFSARLSSTQAVTFTVTAHFPGYLLASSGPLSIGGDNTFDLGETCLLAGDIAGPTAVTVIRPAYCEEPGPIETVGDPDGLIDVVDLSMISLNDGVKDSDVQWGLVDGVPNECHPEFNAYRCDLNGDGRVDGSSVPPYGTDYALALQNQGFAADSSIRNWQPCTPQN